MSVSVTALYAGVLALLSIIFTARVGAYRARHRVVFGDGRDEQLLRRQRAHGNFAEQVPFTVLLLALVELGGGASWLLHVLGVVLITARLAHYFTLMTRPAGLARPLAMIATFAVQGVCGLVLIASAVGLWHPA